MCVHTLFAYATKHIMLYCNITRYNVLMLINTMLWKHKSQITTTNTYMYTLFHSEHQDVVVSGLSHNDGGCDATVGD